MLQGPLERALGVPTPKMTGGMFGTPRSRTSKPRKLNLLTQHFQVQHQRVCLDVDFCTQRLRGHTEITIAPTSSLLRCVKLDAREMNIKRILINGVQLVDYVHNDQLYINDPATFEELATSRIADVRDVCSADFSVAQHAYLRRKLGYIFGQIEDDLLRSQEKPDNLNSEELLILLPESLKIQPSDHTAFHTPTSLVPTNVTPLLVRNRATGELYTPIQIHIEYEVVNPKNGVHFICLDLTDSARWHVYTANSDYNVSTSSWVPCVDNLLERNIWSIELSIPRSVKDVDEMRANLQRTFESSSVEIKESEIENSLSENVERVQDNDVAKVGEDEAQEDMEDMDVDVNDIDSEDVDMKERTEEKEESGQKLEIAEEKETVLENDGVVDDLKEISTKEESDQNAFTAQENNIVKDQKEADTSKEIDSIGKEENENDEDDSIDLLVCTGDSNNTKESAHPTDISKKVVSWSIFSPVAAHHVGWSVGAFLSVELASFVDSNAAGAEDEDVIDDFEELEKDESSPPVMLYFLPGQEDDARNTCIFANKALEFFLKEYGSYPFSSYGLVFVEGPKHPYSNFAGLAVLSSDLLYPANVIEPMFQVTEDLLECIASQWSGVNIVPQCFNDMWCTIGIAKFMAFQFIRALMGVNEYRYQIKKKMDAIVAQDVGQRPIGLLSLQAPVSESSLKFVRLKAPIILFILDRRMTKTDKSFGFSRVLPKIFLQAMSGDLQNSALSTQHFQYVCEKVNRNRLEAFFKQWVYGVGTPNFIITQKFNKKRSMIEVIIRQTQLQEHKPPHPKPETFLTDAVAYLDDDAAFPVQQTFLGPMTIRVHEADGTPYEHIVDIKNSVVKFDVQYNTKFKRMKKNREDPDVPLFLRLGDVLESASDVQLWRLEEWPKRDEEVFDPFEWLRVDTDFEWIATFTIKQPDYMFGAQLQQDRDIEAQLAAIDYFGQQEKPSAVYCTMLTRTLVDARYFYGVRMAAAKALAQLSTESTNFKGRFYLLKAFAYLFCFKDSYVPMSNSFEDFGKFFLQTAIPGYLAGIKDDTGATPRDIQVLLFNLLRYNDNSNNAFLDCFYVSELAQALVKSVVGSVDDLDGNLIVDADQRKFVAEVVDELMRLRKLDRYVPSYHAEVSYACLQQKIALARAGLTSMSFEELLYLTSTKYDMRIRTLAFRGLFLLGALKNAEVLKYFLDVCLLERSTPAFSAGLVRTLVDSVADVAINGAHSTLDDPEFESTAKATETPASGPAPPVHNSAIVVEESQELNLNARRDALAKATVKGTIELLRKDLAHGKGLQHVLWQLMHSSLIGIAERKAVFVLCDILYAPKNTLVVRLPIPCVQFEELKKKIVARDMGDGKIIVKREARFKILLSAKIILNEKPKLLRKAALSMTEESAPPKLKLRLGGGNSEARTPVERESQVARSIELSASDKAGSEANGEYSEGENVLKKAPEAVSDKGSTVIPKDDPVDLSKITTNGFEPSKTLVSAPTLVRRDTRHVMRLTFSLPPSKLLAVRPVGTVTLRFTQSKNIDKLREITGETLPKRYVKINTVKRTVKISERPFTEVIEKAQEEMQKEKEEGKELELTEERNEEAEDAIKKEEARPEAAAL